MTLPRCQNGFWFEDDEETCALLFFGLGRKFKDIAFPSVKKNILAFNRKCDVFVHTYNVTRAFGARKGERGTGFINTSEVLLLTDQSMIQFESEEDFQNKRGVGYYRNLFPKPSSWEFPTSIDNMIRQWHSLERVWAKMEVAEENIEKRYNNVALFRLDVLFTHPISIDVCRNAVIPRLMYKPTPRDSSWGGYNDRFFYGKREYAKCWATQRFSSVERYLRWQKNSFKLLPQERLAL